MLTLRCDGREIDQVTTGSRDVMYQDRSFAAPFVRGDGRLCPANSPLYDELSGICGFERATEIVRSLPDDAQQVTIRDEYVY